MGLDGVYFELLYASLTMLRPTAPLALRRLETNDPLRSPTAYFCSSHPAGWGAASAAGVRHAALLGEITRRSGGRGEHAAGGRGWVAAFNAEQARLLAADEDGGNSLLGLWRTRHWEAVELLRGESGAASPAEYERLLPTMNKETNGLRVRGSQRRKDRDPRQPAPQGQGPACTSAGQAVAQARPAVAVLDAGLCRPIGARARGRRAARPDCRDGRGHRLLVGTAPRVGGGRQLLRRRAPIA